MMGLVSWEITWMSSALVVLLGGVVSGDDGGQRASHWMVGFGTSFRLYRWGLAVVMIARCVEITMR